MFADLQMLSEIAFGSSFEGAIFTTEGFCARVG